MPRLPISITLSRMPGMLKTGWTLALSPFAFDDLEQRFVLAAEVIDVQAEFIELLEAAFHAVRFVDLDQAGAAVRLGLIEPTVAVRRSASRLPGEEMQVVVVLGEGGELLVAEEVVHVLLVAFADHHRGSAEGCRSLRRGLADRLRSRRRDGG